MARRAFGTSIGAGRAPTQNQPHNPGHDQHRRGSSRLLPLQRLHSRIDLINIDLITLGRSCRSETAADFQESEPSGPPVAVPFFKLPMPKYRPDTKPEPAVQVSVTESLQVVANARILHKPSLQLQHVRHRRRTEKATKRCRKGRYQKEGQGVGTIREGAVNH